MKIGIFATNSDKSVEVELRTCEVRVRGSVPIFGSRSKLVVGEGRDDEN